MWSKLHQEQDLVLAPNLGSSSWANEAVTRSLQKDTAELCYYRTYIFCEQVGEEFITRLIEV